MTTSRIAAPPPPPAPWIWAPLGAAALLGGAGVAGVAGALPGALPWAALGGPALAAALAAAWTWRERRLAAAREALREASRAHQDLALRLRGLLGQVELLTAMREMSRLVSGETEFAALVQAVFDILKGLLAPERMVLYVTDDARTRMEPRALWDGGKVVHGDPVDGPGILPLALDGALAGGAVLREVEGGTLVLTVPLTTESEPIGALQIAFELAGDAAERERRSLAYEQMVRDIALHLAMAVRTPALRARAMRDGLTGLLSKRTFEEALAHEAEHAAGSGDPLSLVMLDLDHFKAVNDTHGHPAGDAVLKEAARRIQASVRGSDCAYRYGGEEFAVLLPGSDAAHAAAVAERIRERIERSPVAVTRRLRLPVTASLGVAVLGTCGTTPADLLGAADHALYDAKHAGRNRVVVAAGAPAVSSRQAR